MLLTIASTAQQMLEKPSLSTTAKTLTPLKQALNDPTVKDVVDACRLRTPSQIVAAMPGLSTARHGLRGDKTAASLLIDFGVNVQSDVSVPHITPEHIYCGAI